MKLIRIWRDCGQIVGCIRQRISNFPQRAYWKPEQEEGENIRRSGSRK
jgi:hypothetical protein